MRHCSDHLPVSPVINAINPAFDAPLSDEDKKDILRIADEVASSVPNLNVTSFFGDEVFSGYVPGPKILMSNSYDISLLDTGSPSLLEYRMLLLADADDLFLMRGAKQAAFEEYRSNLLSGGVVDVLQVPPHLQRADVKDPVHLVSWLAETSEMKRLHDVAQRAGCLNIVPYIGSGYVWRLAGYMAALIELPVYVCAPSPRLTQFVNDKLWFTWIVSQCLGKQATPLTHWAYGPAGLTGLVSTFAQRNPRLVVKVPDSAGSRGNLVLTATQICSKKSRQLKTFLLDSLTALGWENSYPVMVEVWDEQVIVSPSVQIWIPHQEQGQPVIEGIFEQVLVGTEATFSGAMRTSLPVGWQERLAREAMKIASLLQMLGYFGRLSFDAVITGSSLAQAQVHWIECNGRWGGVSIPMTFINHVSQSRNDINANELQYIIVQKTMASQNPIRFHALLDLFADDLFDVRNSHEGVIFLSPTATEAGKGVHFVAIAKELVRAQQLATRVQTTLSTDVAEATESLLMDEKKRK